MFPVLVRIGDVEIMSYSVLAFLAMLGGMIVAVLEAKRFQWSIPRTVRLVVECTLLGFLGAHVVYAFTRWSLPWNQWWPVLLDFRYGNVWFGGFITSWLYCIWYAKKNQIPFLQMSDFAGLIVLVAQAIGRLGCVFNGCCYGKPTTLFWGLTLMTDEYGLATVHPVPLYETIYLLSLFAILWRGRSRWPIGTISASYLFFAPLGRILLELLRGDTVRGFVLGEISTSQAIGFVLMLTSIPVFFKRRT